ncbi:glutamine amidotransferase [Klugiella xanthotipulae]|uniref:GMP synthase (Glutamine-hydrolysing) n=1 Tax=Klugiella xanthotipulae TaxID=244735 RepID=A0A543I5D5_9MICO|nr:glutamine amidotransferase [Klugiella xanthotipulae]TQM65799.1 GMP synthase (glutamine-hydrolysing) [Klugiella xanthotipulae]
MKPFLLLATRAEDLAADEEYELFWRLAGLSPDQLHRVRMEAGPLPAIRLDDYSGVFVGGSPYNSSDPEESKSPTQKRVEAELAALLDEVVARDFPFLGACYGIGALGAHQGAVIDRRFTEPISSVRVTLTAAGRADALLTTLPDSFDAFVGHKEAASSLPDHAVLLASSPTCPVQMFRVGNNVYATQFHPELTLAGIITRIRTYQTFGYFAPAELDAMIADISDATVTEPQAILTAFVQRYARE